MPGINEAIWISWFFLLLNLSAQQRSSGRADANNRPSIEELRWQCPGRNGFSPSIVAWILTALGGLVSFETQRANLLCKIYGAKIPGVMSRAELCGFGARIAVS